MNNEDQRLSPMKNIFQLPLRKDGPVITLRSDFDSGNMNLAEIGMNGCIVITPGHDCAGTIFESHSKGWFYFSVCGFGIHAKQKFVIKKMQQLSNQLKFHQYFKPVFKYANESWERVQHSIAFTKEDDTELHFEFQFEKVGQVYFAYAFPFSFEECEKMLKETQKQMKHSKNIYYKDQILVRTVQGRPIHLLTVSSNNDKLETQEPNIDEHLFTENHAGRPAQFSPQKKIVFISARVHPSETPASHTFNGLLKFLLSKDARAFYLRKKFVFKFIPMLNPDGVANGNYRMDFFGQNLNRFYLNPDFEKQPAVYAVKKIGQYYSEINKLCFYLDLHAHPQKKGNFIYGNSFENYKEQAETQLFARILSLNCIQFDYVNSSFSKHHMGAKDANEELTKEGCGRVVFNRNLNVIYSYTMECGFTSSTYLNDIVSIENGHRMFQKHSIASDEMENIKSVYYANKKNVYFTIKAYENLGKNILVSVLDLFLFNPASRIPNTEQKSLDGIRLEIRDRLNLYNKDFKDNKFIIRSAFVHTKNPKIITTEKIILPKKTLLFRAPSIVSSKDIISKKIRHKTTAKLVISRQL